MRIICLFAAGAILAQPASAEIIRGETCRKAADLRLIQVMAPGEVGAACDVVYTRDGGAKVSVPYNANVDQDFCRARAAELAANLIAEGFACSVSSAEELEAALDGAAPAIADSGDEAAADTVALDAPLDMQLKKIATTDEPVAAPPEESLRQPGADVVENVEEEPAFEMAAQSLESATPAEPIQLAADAQPSGYRAPSPPKASGPGRIVGAPPSNENIADVASKPASAPGADELPARPVNDVISGVLAANAAAWNEGNLDAFMAFYVDSAELMMVKDAVVTTGWRDVRKSYETEIQSRGGMGRLTFSDINVSMTSSDIATAVGRYRVSADGGTAEGVMTLVLKQIDGRWRIVQDTRVAAPASH